MAYGKDHKRYPKEIVVEARMRYASGEKVKSIAESMGVSPNCVYQWVGSKKKGTSIKPFGESSPFGEACALLATVNCPIVWFDKDPAKCAAIARTICSCADCGTDRETFSACWRKYLIGGCNGHE